MKALDINRTSLSKLIYFKKRDLSWVEELLLHGVDPKCTEYDILKNELAYLESEFKEMLEKK